jgi:hypothetical protein
MASQSSNYDSLESLEIYLESDIDNFTESENAQIFFSQDGRITSSIFGLDDSNYTSLYCGTTTDNGFKVYTGGNATGATSPPVLTSWASQPNLAFQIDSNQNIAFTHGGTPDNNGGIGSVIYIESVTSVPAAGTVTGGGLLYVSNGVLLYRGSSGTLTVIAPA